MATAENPHAGQGSVLLDIGGTVGALVVTMPAELEGAEVEINRRVRGGRHDHDHVAARDHDHGAGHGHHHRPHVAVVARPVAAGGVVHSLVFPDLVEGDYELYRRDGGPVELAVSITGGAVTEAAWPRPVGGPAGCDTGVSCA